MRIRCMLPLLAASVCNYIARAEADDLPQCITQMGTSSVSSVATSTSTIIQVFTVTATTTLTPMTTLTPTRTSTITSTSTVDSTAMTPIATATTTSTYSATSTLHSTTTLTRTKTATTTTTYRTVAAGEGPGFTPFASLDSVVSAGGGSANKRSLPRLAHRDRAASNPRAVVSPHPQASTFPQSVTCYIQIPSVTVSLVSSTASNTVTVTAKKAVTIRTTRVTTKTVVIIPTPATTTKTIRTTTTSTTTLISKATTTTTTTITTSTIIPTATIYPQCQPNNLIGQVGGKPLVIIGISNPYTISAATTTLDAERCCQVCAQTPDCAGFAFGGAPLHCWLVGYGVEEGGTCNATQVAFTAYWSSQQYPVNSTFGNGDCGRGAFGGTI